MSILTSENVVYMIQNSQSGEFLTDLKAMTFSGSVWDGQHFANRELASKARTKVRTTLDCNPVAIDVVRVRADVRRGTRGRPRKIEG